MKSLSRFLAEHIIEVENFDDPELEKMIDWMQKHIHEGIENFKKHLGKDPARTVAWAMLERQFVVTLEHMEDLVEASEDNNG